jgi:hypothetical protein
MEDSGTEKDTLELNPRQKALSASKNVFKNHSRDKYEKARRLIVHGRCTKQWRRFSLTRCLYDILWLRNARKLPSSAKKIMNSSTDTRFAGVRRAALRFYRRRQSSLPRLPVLAFFRCQDECWHLKVN